MTKRTYGRVSKTQMCDFTKERNLFDDSGRLIEKQKKDPLWKGILCVSLYVACLWLLAFTAQVYGLN